LGTPKRRSKLTQSLHSTYQNYDFQSRHGLKTKYK
jgi:hypothetical protein